MNTGLEQIRQTMADYLCQQGVPAVTAWPAAPRQEWTEPVVVVSVRGCRAGSASFQDYLGEGTMRGAAGGRSGTGNGRS